MASTTAPSPSVSTRRVPVAWAAGALVLGSLVATLAIARDDASTADRPVVAARSAVVISPDAAERWSLADGDPAAVTSADAAERRAVAELERRQASCRGGSPDAAERCLRGG